ncbi:hypothetical protein [Chryseobacterium camelliae]|uniref:hypothetical protein n=1 Tax=Chryseobacterium camelliae TaxID=1265445 RepID=UPI00285C9F2F|nr:hypothetical protein [Chryseobacterium camelliae]MDR6516218.1 hypothetical protein [Chryseobacterium camelliae]
MRNKRRIAFYFLIVLLMTVSCTIVNCIGREDEPSDNESGSYRVELKYSGEHQKWTEKLTVSAIVKNNTVPTVSGIDVLSTKKVSDTEYVFEAQESLPMQKSFTTSANVKILSVSGEMHLNSTDPGEMTVDVKVYKNERLKFELPFIFKDAGSYPYYNVNVK